MMDWFYWNIHGLINGLAIYRHNGYLHYLDTHANIVKVLEKAIAKPRKGSGIFFKENYKEKPRKCFISNFAGMGKHYEGVYLMNNLIVITESGESFLTVPLVNKDNEIIGRLRVKLAQLSLPEKRGELVYDYYFDE